MIENSDERAVTQMLTLREPTKETLRSVISGGRIPHTVIIECDDKDERDNAALYLACAAVCREHESPCLCCDQCRKAMDRAHPDIIIPLPSKKLKSNIISLKDLRDEYLSQASIKPNESDTKVYIFFDADTLLREDSQNTLLKLIEEPPQSMLFVFAVSSAESMLMTVRSRARIITLERQDTVDESDNDIARSIAEGLISLHEYDLMLAMNDITKDNIMGVLARVGESLRLALNMLSGVPTQDSTAIALSRTLDRRRLIALIETTADAVDKSYTNIGTDLLVTWLCAQYRRISWQK